MKDHARADWERALLVCGKCSRKLGDGFGPSGKTSLARALRREPGFGKGRKARVGVVEVKCLGICPKHAVTVVDTADLSRWRLVRPGEDLGALAHSLHLVTLAKAGAHLRPDGYARRAGDGSPLSRG